MINDLILFQQYSKTTSNTLVYNLYYYHTKNKIFTSNRNNQQCHCCIANKSIKNHCVTQFHVDFLAMLAPMS